MPDPRAAIIASVERARAAIGNMAPLTDMERAVLHDCLDRVRVPRAKRKDDPA